MEPLRIAYVVPYFEEGKFGGGELHAREVAKRLRARGHDVQMVTTNLTRHASSFEPKAPRRGTPWGLPTRRHRVSLLAGLALKPMGFYPLAFGLLFDRAIAQADLVLISGLEDPTATLALVAAWLHKKPVVVTPHTHTELWRTQGLDRRALMACFESYRGCYVQITTEAEVPFWRARVSDERLLSPAGCGAETVPEAWLESKEAARKALGLPLDQGLVLFLGRLHWGKGVLRALAAMEDAPPLEGHLALVGFEERHPALLRGERLHLREYVARRWPRSRATFVGAVDERTKHRWLAACDLLVLPSYHESFGLVFLEAWQHGRPVVGWDTGGIPAVVSDGVDGFVVGSIPDLRDRIATLLAKPSLAAQLGEAGRRKARERYTWDRVVDRLEANLGVALAREAARRAQVRTSPEILEVER